MADVVDDAPLLLNLLEDVRLVLEEASLVMEEARLVLEEAASWNLPHHDHVVASLHMAPPKVDSSKGPKPVE